MHALPARVAGIFLLPALALAGCAPPPPPAAPVAGVYGVIIASRPASAGGIGRDILAAIGSPAASGPASGPDGTEFIIRADDGRTLSVVQGDDGTLRPGARVVVTQGIRTRIAPAPG